MRKSEMNTTEVATHDAIASTLAAVGWKPQRDQLEFEEGAWTVYDIDMQRFNGRSRLRVFRDPTTDELGLSLNTPRGETLGLYLKCGARLQEVLDAIVEMQDAIDERTYKECVAHLVHVCPEVYIGTDDVERIRLVDRKPRVRDQ